MPKAKQRLKADCINCTNKFEFMSKFYCSLSVQDPKAPKDSGLLEQMPIECDFMKVKKWTK